MDPFRRIHSSNSKANLKSLEFQRRRGFCKEIAETDENELPLLHNGAPTKLQDVKKEVQENFLFQNTSSSFKNKILAERKDDPSANSSRNLEITPHVKSMAGSDPKGVPFPISSYDPITNYTSPRPEFLRYNPNMRRGLLQRIDGEKRGKEALSASPLLSPGASSNGGNVSDSENEGEEKLGEEKQQSWYSSVLWNLFLVFGVLMFIFFCVSCGSYPSFKGSENSADKFQKIKAVDPLGLGIFMNLSQMCPIVRESSCNLVYLEMDGMLGREKLEEGESWNEGKGSGLKEREVVQDLLVQNGDLADDDSVAEEKMERDGQDKWYPWPLAELARSNKSVIAVEIVKGKSIACTSDESSLASQAQNVSSSTLTNQLDEFHLVSLELHEPSWIFLSKLHQSSPPDLEEEAEFSLNPDTELKLEYSFYKFSEGSLPLFLISVSSLVVLVGLLRVFQKYFQMKHLPVPPSESCQNAETEENTVSNFQNAGLMHLDHPNTKEASRIGPPRVELLGEFSLIDAGVSTSLGLKLNKKDYSDSKFSYRQSRQERKMLSSSPDAVSTSDRFSMKVIADKKEASDAVITPLRRSSRLRSR